MSEILNTALTGLLAYQRALSTTSHNISNSTTPGYSRQDTILGTMPPDAVFGTGNGVLVAGLRRNYDSFLIGQYRDAISQQNSFSIINDQAGLIDDILSDPQGGITPALQAFFSALQDHADDPASISGRHALLGQANALTQRFQTLDARFAEQASSANGKIKDIVNRINDLSASIRDLNVDLLGSRAQGQGTAPDLLDRRDNLLQELSQYVSVQVLQNSDNTINVFIGSGQTLVTNDTAFQLQTVPSAQDGSLLSIGYNGFAGLSDITNAITGGELGGMIDFTHNLLGDARNRLGRVALGLAETFNTQHRDGMDLNGDLGGDFFNAATPQIIGNVNNTGAATIASSITSVAGLTAKDYQLSYDGANWTLQSRDGLSSVTGAGPSLTLDGFDVTIGGVGVAGDQFLIRPTRTGAQLISTAISDPREIAAAVPITSSSAVSNAGNARISSGSVLDVSDANLLDSVEIRFNTPASTFDLIDAGTGAVLAAAQPFTSGGNIDFNGWRVQITGTPQAGDRFTVASNAGGAADNRNALSLAGLQNAAVFDGGTASYQETYGELVTRVGAQTRQAEVGAAAQSAISSSILARKEAVSGVNLDEEAADLLRFQQAYQAAARAVATADDIFQSLLSAL